MGFGLIGAEILSIYYTKKSKKDKHVKYHFGVGVGLFFIAAILPYPIIGMEYEF